MRAFHAAAVLEVVQMRLPLVRKVIMFTPGQMHPKEVWGSAQHEHSISSVMKPYCIHRTKTADPCSSPTGTRSSSWITV